MKKLMRLAVKAYSALADMALVVAVSSVGS